MERFVDRIGSRPYWFAAVCEQYRVHSGDYDAHARSSHPSPPFSRKDWDLAAPWAFNWDFGHKDRMEFEAVSCGLDYREDRHDICPSSDIIEMADDARRSMPSEGRWPCRGYWRPSPFPKERIKGCDCPADGSCADPDWQRWWNETCWRPEYGRVVRVDLGRWSYQHSVALAVFFERSGSAYVELEDVWFPVKARGACGHLGNQPNTDENFTALEAVLSAEWILRLVKSVDSGVVVRSNEAEVRRAEMVLKNTRNPKKRRKAERVYRRTVYAFERPPQKSGGGGGRGTGAGVAKHRVRAHWHHYWVGPSHRGWEMGIKSNEDDTRRLVRKLVLGYERGSVEPDRSIIAVR